ncbi:TolC family protein [Sphingobacterium multivorum]|uniref:Efflux transporter, outer membrane factor (OMF) lipoprotein, NodT family n=1 Tax=Sphingobacterium multivorum TaxID=28454 RepID=A0A2X2JXP7_SPHMU|nr:TolC family protein [Sphingobacterium multivorum]QRQ62306.1 TolC family protein [Sphingobacterium multivorum]SPZ92545.1 efflux transporter, outer membrane factor (OMF) lipoprotein, NodT family [Sphingobacterium multivorum]
MVKWFYCIGVFFFFGPPKLLAQHSEEKRISLKDAISQGENYHQLQSILYEAEAAAKHINVVQYSKLPNIDANYQVGLATANNTTGLFYPNGILPISGPPSVSNSFTPTVGSAAGVLLNWDILTFGQKDAKIGEASAEYRVKEAVFKESTLEHRTKIINTYLDLILSLEHTKIYSANTQRTKINLKQSAVLSKNGIRPGADSTFFSSELSKATVEVLNSTKQQKVYQLLLAHLISSKDLPLPTDTAFISVLPPITQGGSNFSQNPMLKTAESSLSLNLLKENTINKDYLPKVTLWSTAFGRGSGFQENGTNRDIKGLSLNRINYAIGFQLSLPIMKYGETRKKLQEQQMLTLAAKEKIDQSKDLLSIQQQIASETLSNCILVAAETTKQLNAAQYAFFAIQARYSAGLINLSDLIQVQYSLLKAELDNKKAYLDAWKAYLLLTVIDGDVTIFTNAIQK